LISDVYKFKYDALGFVALNDMYFI
jgi:hypothetical protein